MVCALLSDKVTTKVSLAESKFTLNRRPDCYSFENGRNHDARPKRKPDSQMRTGFRKTSQFERLLSEKVTLNSGVDLDARAMVELTEMLFTYLPLAEAGLTRRISV